MPSMVIVKHNARVQGPEEVYGGGAVHQIVLRCSDVPHGSACLSVSD